MRGWRVKGEGVDNGFRSRWQVVMRKWIEMACFCQGFGLVEDFKSVRWAR